MTYDLIAISKMVALLMFFPLFVGIVCWAYWPSNKATFDALAAVPLRDD